MGRYLAMKSCYCVQTGLLPLFALIEIGYKRIIELSSSSFLNNDELSDPHLDFETILHDNEGIAPSFFGVKVCRCSYDNTIAISQSYGGYFEMKDIPKCGGD